MSDAPAESPAERVIHPLVSRWLADARDGAPACTDCSVRQAALFSALEGDALVQAHTHVSPLRLAIGQRLLTRGEVGQAVYTVRSGLLRIERFTAGGQRRIVRLAGAGTLLGTEGITAVQHVDDVIACTKVELCRISLGLFPLASERGQALVTAVLRQAQRDMDAMVHWAMHLTRGTARERVLHLLRLLDQYADAQAVIWLPRRDEIGDMLDLTFETASRQISALRKEGVLQVISQHRARVDRHALAAALQGLDARD